MRKTSDWDVTVFDGEGEIVDSWTIKNRTEREAESEALADVARIESADDWTMTEVKSVYHD